MGANDYGFGDKKMQEQPASGMRRPRNFWLPPGTKDKFVFLDSRPHYADETETGGGKEREVRVAYLTVIRLWKSQRDDKWKISKDLFRMKKGTHEIFADQVTKREGLRGCVYEAYRQNDKKPVVGGQFDFEGKMTDAQLVKKFKPYLGFLKNETPEEYLKGYNYPEVLALPEREWGSSSKQDNESEPDGWGDDDGTHDNNEDEQGSSAEEQPASDDDGGGWAEDWRGGPKDAA